MISEDGLINNCQTCPAKSGSGRLSGITRCHCGEARRRAVGGASVTGLIMTAAVATVGVLDWMCGRHSSVNFFEKYHLQSHFLSEGINRLLFSEKGDKHRKGGASLSTLRVKCDACGRFNNMFIMHQLTRLHSK